MQIGVYQKFLKKLVLSWWHDYGDVTEVTFIFWKNTSPAVQILYIASDFKTES